MLENKTLTALDMLPAIGTSVTVQFEQIQVNCTVTDVKVSYGRPRIQIKPVTGQGTQWIELARIREVKTCNLQTLQA